MMLRNWGLVLALILLWAGFFAGGFKPLNSDIFFSKKSPVPNRLSHISTSPRWKYPFGNHNAIIAMDGNYIFPESTIPIVSIEIKDKGLFDYYKGIYIRGAREWEARKPETAWWDRPANYRNRGRKWERKATIRFTGFGPDEVLQKAGIRINGNATRAFPQKSLRLVFRGDYEKEGITNRFFDNAPNTSIKTMLLRNAGNDWDRAFLRDVLTTRLSVDLNLETQPFKAVNVYISGEYWGLHYLRPKIDDDYLAGKYGIADTVVSIIEHPGIVYRGPKRGINDFNVLLDFAKSQDLSDSSNYSRFSKKLDIESFVDYLIINMLIVNTDWPQNNWMVWKDLSGSVNNGQWKWILKDTDYGLGFFDANAYDYDMYTKVLENESPIGIFFNALLKNGTFKSHFEQRQKEILSASWNIDRFNTKLDSISNVLAPEMPYQIDRWRTHLSAAEWESEVEAVRTFYELRLNN
jgi:hypothetical protein